MSVMGGFHSPPDVSWEPPTEPPPKPADARRSVVHPGPDPVAGHVIMIFWCGHEFHLYSGDEPYSACPICHPH